MNSDSNLVFDPDQDPEEKRELRQNYRALTRRIEEQQANPNDYTAEDVLSHVQTADGLFNRVKQPQEATLDSHLLLLASNVGAQKARAMKSGSGSFDVDDFISKLVLYMSGGKRLTEENFSRDLQGEDMTDLTLDWNKIGRKALAKSRRVPTMGFMLGPLSIEQKKRAHVKRAKVARNEEDRKAPQQLKEEDIQRSENETVKNVAQIEQILADLGSINIFRFIVNPNDFAQSVENIFYLSFLIRDGKVAFETTDEGEPVVYVCESPSDEDYSNGLKKQQMVLEFDMSVWRRAIKVFNITESTIPPRQAAGTKLGTSWYG